MVTKEIPRPASSSEVTARASGAAVTRYVRLHLAIQAGKLYRDRLSDLPFGGTTKGVSWEEIAQASDVDMAVANIPFANLYDASLRCLAGLSHDDHSLPTETEF
jgi:hypothetical protein